MKKMKPFLSTICGSLMALAIFLPLSVPAMEHDDDSIAEPSSPRAVNPIEPLEVLAAVEVVRPYVVELKEVINRASALKQRIDDEEREEKNRINELMTQAATQGRLQDVFDIYSRTLTSKHILSLSPQDDPIYRTPEGSILRQELNTVLDKLLFVVDTDTLQQRYYTDISTSHVRDIESRMAETIPGLNEYKPALIEAISRQLTAEEKYLLPVGHLVSRILHYDNVYSLSYYSIPAIRLM